MTDIFPRVGLLFMGNERNEIWGSAITTYYLGEALRALGCTVVRKSAGELDGFAAVFAESPDLVISEGVPAELIPDTCWRSGARFVFWALSSLFYSDETIRDTPFHGVATNSWKL